MIIFHKPVLASWYANIGALSLAKEELVGWPTGKWSNGSNVASLHEAESYFLKSLNSDYANQTANYRMGLIWMLRRDFSKAVNYLEISYRTTPSHRGIIKNLGYCYTWLGEYDKALLLLEQIPEAGEEMQTYTWWWNTNNREDLAQKASNMANLLSSE